MAVADMKTPDKYTSADGYWLDSQVFRSPSMASAYLMMQGFSAEEAHDYLWLLYNQYSSKFRERCFA